MSALKYRTYPTIFDGFFNDFGRTLTKDNVNAKAHVPDIEILKGETNYRVLAKLPGVKKEDLKVEIENGHLVFSGKIDDNKREGYEAVYSDFVNYKEFKRSLKLDLSRFDVEKVDAKLNDGLLEIILPVSEKVQPRKIEIN